MGFQNKTDFEFENYLGLNDKYVSIRVLEIAKTINVIAMFLVIIVGIFGHSLIIFIYSQKRFRTNSSNVYLLCLAINDMLFLIIHLFEDTIRTFKELYLAENTSSLIINLIAALNLIDKYNIACQMISYFRYILRFTSAYMLVMFTLQRLSIVKSPMSLTFKSKKSAWLICFTIVFISFIINSWIIFIFEIHPERGVSICDVKRKWSDEYFKATAFYIILIIFIPIIVMLISNLVIIKSLMKSDSRQKSLNNKAIAKKSCTTRLSTRNGLISEITQSKSFKFEPRCSNANLEVKKSMAMNSTTNLFVISILFIILNMPYLIAWSVFYYQYTFDIMDDIRRNYVFSLLKISEIFYMLNYALLFYVYCCSGAKFRQQLKYSSSFQFI